MKTFTRIVYPTGHVFEVLTSVIADDRTAYYAMQDPGRTREQHAEETRMMFASDFEVVDWAKNNMRADDVLKVSRLVAFNAPDFRAMWDDAELQFVDEQGRPDVTSLGERSLTAPIELAMTQAVGEGRNCMMLAFQQPDTGAVTSAVAVMVGPQHVVEGYIAVISDFDTFMAQQAANAASAGH